MGDKLYEENSVQAIAESIRSKLGVDTTYKIAEMSGAINTIVVPDGTTNITENGYHDVAAYEQAYVHVEGGITPTGTTNIYENGDHDVTDYATAHVAVPQPIGKKTITENGTDIDIAQYATLDVQVDPNVGTKTINQNGVYNASDDNLDGYSKVTVSTPVPTGKKTIATNGTDIDVSSYALVDVAVPGPVGKKVITENGTNIDIAAYATADVQVNPNVGTKSVSTNGVYKASADNLDGYSQVVVNTPVPTGTLDIDENGTYNVSQYANVDVDIEQYGKPVVPQTGTWQYKSTYPCGFMILGKDDDVADSAQFVRMINAYGWKVTLNSTQQCQSQSCNSDSDTEYSTYPANAPGPFFPNGCTINELNKFVIKYDLGEIAMHGVSAEKIWDSANLTGTTLDNYYATYTTGGGTKTKEEFKEAFIEKYADMDVAQGAPIVARKRKLLQAALDNWVYTIGTWGGNFDVVIDGINCGDSGAVNSTTQSISRSQNWMGDGQLNNQIVQKGPNPYWIYRDSSGLLPGQIEADCLLAYNSRCCIDAFHHYYLNGTAEKWNDFKTTLDILDSYVQQNKICVVTRKQYYELGEFVEHPITSISISTKNQYYNTGTTINESIFNIAANLDNGTTVVCQDDKILDLSNIDSSTEGTYTAYLEYRGFKAQCMVTISDEGPTNYLLNNASFSGTSMTRNSNIAEAVISPAIHFENGKYYRYQFHVRMETEISYATHYASFDAPSIGSYVGWRTSGEGFIDPTVNGITEGDVTFDIEVHRDQDVECFVRTKTLFNTSVANWTITNAYIYEIPAPEEEGGE